MIFFKITGYKARIQAPVIFVELADTISTKSQLLHKHQTSSCQSAMFKGIICPDSLFWQAFPFPLMAACYVLCALSAVTGFKFIPYVSPSSSPFFGPVMLPLLTRNERQQAAITMMQITRHKHYTVATHCFCSTKHSHKESRIWL